MSVVFDELHLTVLTPDRFPPKAARQLRQLLRSRHFRTALLHMVRQSCARHRDLTRVRWRLSR